jgi:hypothetical protein
MRTSSTITAGLFATLLLVTASSCESWLDPKDDSKAIFNPWRSLTAGDMAAISRRTSILSRLRPDLAWLGDTLSAALQAERAMLISENVSTGLTGPFYSTGLLRHARNVSEASAEYDVVLLNDPANPTDFIVLHVAGSSPTFAPDSISGTNGGSPGLVRATFSISTVNRSTCGEDRLGGSVSRSSRSAEPPAHPARI